VLENRYRIKYRHPKSGAAGVTILNTAAEMAAERARLEALGYVVVDVFLPHAVKPLPI
jgi:hypothetical protein